MYRIPSDLDLSPAVGEFTTQLRVGQFDLQFTFGPVDFAVQSPVKVFRGDDLVAQWHEGRWPDPGFFDVLNDPIRLCNIVGDRQIVIEFESGLAMQLEDNSDSLECILITIDGQRWII